MSSEARVFLDCWLGHDLPRRMVVTSASPTPLTMIDALLEGAARNGISEHALQEEAGDLFEAIVRAMMDVSQPVDAMPRGGNESGSSPAARTPTVALRLAISYLDGLRDVVGADVDLAADLVLCNLARQGFQLVPWTGEAATVSMSSTLAHYSGAAALAVRPIADDLDRPSGSPIGQGRRPIG